MQAELRLKDAEKTAPAPHAAAQVCHTETERGEGDESKDVSVQAHCLSASRKVRRMPRASCTGAPVSAAVPTKKDKRWGSKAAAFSLGTACARASGRTKNAQIKCGAIQIREGGRACPTRLQSARCTCGAARSRFWRRLRVRRENSCTASRRITAQKCGQIPL